MAAPRRIEGNFSQGWPFAIFITALAVAAWLTAGYIHKRTFHDPNDALGPSATATAGTSGPSVGSK